MGFIQNEKTFINNQVFQFEDRLNSQYTKFLEKPPTYVTYYHINNISSTADNGFQNVQNLLGDTSSLRYREVKDFPLYGISQLVLDLSDEEEGLQTTLDGEAIILPNTIKPLPNDYFTISYLKDSFLFMVTEVDYDTIKSNNYYKIQFTVKSITPESIDSLETQVDETFTCKKDNIGTEDRCIIEDDELLLVDVLKGILDNIKMDYKNLFYINKYNSFIFQSTGTKLYNKFLANFINGNKLYENKNDFTTLLLNIEDMNETFSYEYNNSIYRMYETTKKNKLDTCTYNYSSINNYNSIFGHYRDFNVDSLNVKGDEYKFIEDRVVTKIKNNERIVLTDTISPDGELINLALRDNYLSPIIIGNYSEMMGKYAINNQIIFESLSIDFFNNNINSLSDLNFDVLDNFTVEPSYMSFIYVPFVIYMLERFLNKCMKN